jgi:hypothetical protein
MRKYYLEVPGIFSLFSLKTTIYAILSLTVVRENHAVLGGKYIEFHNVAEPGSGIRIRIWDPE